MSASKAEILDFLVDSVATQTRLEKHEIDIETPLATYGIDSVYAISLCADLEDWLGVPVEPTIAWDYPSIEKMADFLVQEVHA